MTTANDHSRTVLITGCSSGIGLATASMLKGRGWRVLATARKAEDRERLEREHGLETLALELTDEASVAACAEEALHRTDGRLYALYNNAAYGLIGAIEDVPVRLLRQHFEANVFGTLELTRRILPAMRARGAGRIVMCSSILGLVSGPYRGPYCASKYALEALADALRMELKGTGILVSIIEPGAIESSFLPTALATFKANIDPERSPHREAYEQRIAGMRSARATPFKLGPDAVARAVVHAVESWRPRIRYRVTLPAKVAAVLKRVLPDRALDALVSRW